MSDKVKGSYFDSRKYRILLLEKQYHGAITINNNKMKILTTLQERHIYNVVHPRWDIPTQKFSVLYYYIIQQNKWI